MPRDLCIVHREGHNRSNRKAAGAVDKHEQKAIQLQEEKPREECLGLSRKKSKEGDYTTG